MVASWDVAQDVAPLDLRDLIRRARQELITLLGVLDDEEWQVPAVGAWNVHDVTLHLFQVDVGRLPHSSSFEMDYRSTAEAIERDNDAWVEVARFIPPALVLELLQLTGRRFDEHLAGLDMASRGAPVGWTGSGRSPNWLHIAREYTERWVHQQHIRDAVGREALKEKEWMHPVFETFMLALPRAYEGVTAPRGTNVRVNVMGDSGGTWCVQRDDARWRIRKDATSVDAEVQLPQEVAWRLYVRLISPGDAMSRIHRVGDVELTEPACRAVAIMTTVP